VLLLDPETGALLERRTIALPSSAGLVTEPTEVSWRTFAVTAVARAPEPEVVR
jgi:hypothetical protein